MISLDNPNFITFVKKYQVNISGYLAELLEEQEYMTLPGIGALVATYQPAAFDEGNRGLLPPSRQLNFNPGLNVNDGLLAGFIAHKEKITVARARILVEQFADDVAYRLHRGETIELERIGKLTEKDGRIEFIPCSGALSLPDAFGLERAILPHSGLQSGDEKKVKTADNQLPGKRKRILLWAIVAALLISLILIVVVLSREDKTGKRVDTKDAASSTAEQVQPVSSLPPAPADTIPETTPAMTGDSPQPLPGKNWYYLVGGSFKSPQNAGEYITEMETKGFHPVLLGKIGSFFVVAIDSFPTSREARKASQRYSDLIPDTDFWIYQN